MNIFATSKNPREAAKFLDNKRVVKMVLETAQLLSGALRLNGVEEDRLYKLTHENHPCSIWTRKTRGNYNWLLMYFINLCGEYTKQYGKTHKCESLLDLFSKYENTIPAGELEEFVNCAANNGLGLDYKHVTPTTEAYTLYLQERWKTDKNTPKWRTQ
jgi:hypothetical protein